MSNRLIIKNSILFGLPNFLGKLITIVLLPLTSKFLSLEDFGLLTVASILIIFTSSLVQFGASYVINKFWFNNNYDRGELLFNLILFSFSFSILLSVVLSIFTDSIIKIIFPQYEIFLREIFPWIIIQILFISTNGVFEAFLVISKKAWLSCIVSLVVMVVSQTIYVVVVIYSGKIQYIILGQILVTSLFGLFQGFLLLPSLKYKVNIGYLKIIFLITFPILIRNLISLLKTQFDKIYVSKYFSQDTLALYGFAGNTTSLLTLVGNSFIKGFSPNLYEMLSNDTLTIFRINFLFFFYFYIISIVNFLFILFGHFLLDILSNGLFIQSYNIILLFLLNVVISSNSMGRAEILIYYGKTNLILQNSTIQIIVVILLFLILVNFVNDVDILLCAICTLIGNIVYSSLQYYQSRKLSRINFMEKVTVIYTVFHILTIIIWFYQQSQILIKWTVILHSTIITVHFFYEFFKLRYKQKGIN